MADNTTSVFETSVNVTDLDVTNINDISVNVTGVNDTSLNDTIIKNTIDNSVPFLEIINWILFALTLAVFIYGVTSWCSIKKFRHFRNYVLLNAILANVLRFLLTVMSYVIRPETLKHPLVRLICVCVFLYCVLVYNYWLLVLCYIFYVDFVKVFNVNIRRRYLKSSLFSWGAPLIVGLIYFMAFVIYYASKITQRNFTVAMLLLLMPVAINLVIYIAVLNSLFRGSDIDANISNNKWRRFYIATLIFVLSDAVIILTGLLQIIQVPFGDILDVAEYINIIALDIYFPVIKSNRELWRGFMSKRARQKSIEMK